jgi:hypothetical protein
MTEIHRIAAVRVMSGSDEAVRRGFEAWTAATMFDAIKTTEQAADNAMP